MRLQKTSSMLPAAALAASLVLNPLPAFASSVDWVGANNGYWDVAANWNPASPVATDNVLLGGFDTELRSGSFDILSLAGTGRLTLSGGSLAFAAASSVGSLDMTGGTIDGVGALSISGASAWTGGNMNGAGSTTFNGDLAIGGNVHNITSRAVNFAAATTWTGGDIAIAYAATLTNTGAFLDQNAGNVSNYQWFGSGASFVNAGTYTKTGAGDTTFSIPFSNAGIVNVNAGTLALSGGTNSSGSFNVASGATLQFSGGTHTLGTVTGTGLMLVSGGTVNASIASTFAASSFAMTGGGIDGVGALSISGASTWTGGDMNGAGSTTFNGVLAIGGNVHYITSRAVNFAATTTWTGGDFALNYAATLTNTGAFLDQNAGYVSYYQSFGSGASFVNAGTYTKSGASTTYFSIGFNNAGTVNVNAGTLTLGGDSSGGGSFNVASGATLNFAGGAHTVGAVTGTGLLLIGGTVDASIANAFGGTLVMNGGSLSIADTFSAPSFEMNGGTIGGLGTLSIAGASTWTYGHMYGAGSTTFNGDLAIAAGASYLLILERAVNFNATTTWTGGDFQTGNGALITNSGAFLDQNAGSVYFSGYYYTAGSFGNAGTYTKTGAGTTSINIGFSNAGTVNVNAGTLALGGGGASGGGTFNVASGATLNFAGGAHTVGAVNGTGLLLIGGTVDASIANAFGGTLVMNDGSLSIADTFSAPSFEMNGGAIGGLGTLSIAGASTWTYGHMVGAGSTTFNGDLAIAGGASYLRILERAVNFNATTTWTGGSFETGNGALITNSGAFLDQNAGSVYFLGYFYTAGSFSNTGTYTKTGAGTTSINIGFGNAGTVNVNAGTLALGGGGASGGGTFNVASGATLNFASGAHIVGAVTGTGLLLIDGGSVDASIANVFGGTLAMSGGSLNIADTFAASSLDMSGGYIGGVGALSISGASTWNGGGMNGAGSTTFNGNLAIGGNIHYISSECAVNFAATTTWTGGDLHISDAATLTNTGTFLDQNAGNVSGLWYGSGASFINSGAYTKTGAGFTDIYIGFNNAGIVNVNAGTLALKGDFGNSGTVNVNAGTLSLVGGFGNSGTVHLQGGTIDIAYASASEYLGGEWLLEAGTTITSSAIRYVITGAHVRLPATASFLGLESPSGSGVGYLYENRGFLELGKALTVSGTTVPGYGSQLCFTNSGEIAISDGLYAQMSGGPHFLRLLNSGYLRGSGLIGFPAGVEMDGGRLRGEPTLNVQNDVTAKGNCLIEGEVHIPALTVESGTLTVASGASLAGLSYPLLVEDNGGHLVVSGTVTGGIKLNTAGSKLSGTGTVSGNVNAIGEISSTGTLTLQSGLGVPGTLRIASGTLSVAGTTNVTGGELIVDAGATLAGPGLLELNGGILGGNGTVQKNVKVNQGPSTLFGLVGGGLVLGGDADVDADQGFNCMGGMNCYGTNAIKGTINIQGDVDVQPGALILKPDTAITTTNVSVAPQANVTVQNGGNWATRIFRAMKNASVKFQGTARLEIPPVPDALILNDGLFESTTPVQNTATFAGSGTFNAPVQPYAGPLNIGLASVEGGNSPGTIHFSWAGADALTLDGRAANARSHIGVEISDAAGTAGNPQGWDMVDVPNGGVILNVAPGDKINIDLRSLLPDNATIGPLSHFDPAANYLWPFMIAKLGFTGTPVTSGMFHVEDGSFAPANGIAPGLFQVVRPTPNSLALQYGVLPSFWFVDAGGDWSQAGNWNGPVPNGVGARAFFGNVNTAPRTVALDLPATVGEVLFDSSQSFDLTGSSLLTLDASQGDAMLTVTAGQHAIATPLALNDDLSVSTSAGTSLTISGGLSGVGKSLVKNGAGELVLSGLVAYSGNTTVNAGTLTVGALTNSPNITVHGTLNAASLACDALIISTPVASSSAATVPEPSTLVLLVLTGLVLLGVFRGRKLP
ncbi:MAG: autotransporter-associated beta strand repeat-containing protein [Pirellulales bacterium]|nr:autotransporter-associated beta strand repeat-containing protein [Pirellulales bacterium]